ncbi:hypothetical protein NL533_35085, partial [Klebsiella pneumoniae]|nr:hypothetical protein [Klebsiella pneumoniae]
MKESSAQYTFTFDQSLPAGTYTIRAATPGGVTDLAGMTPTGPDGRAGVLGKFIVAAGARAADPHDLGPLFA